METNFRLSGNVPIKAHETLTYKIFHRKSVSNVSHVNRTYGYHVVLPYMEIQANESLFGMHIDSPGNIYFKLTTYW